MAFYHLCQYFNFSNFVAKPKTCIEYVVGTYAQYTFSIHCNLSTKNINDCVYRMNKDFQIVCELECINVTDEKPGMYENFWYFF